jgi:hypothetical protein
LPLKPTLSKHLTKAGQKHCQSKTLPVKNIASQKHCQSKTLLAKNLMHLDAELYNKTSPI